MPASATTDRPKILVVEDSFLVAEELCQELEDEGCCIVGPASRIARAFALADGAPIDGAVLDININGAFSFGLADKLYQRHIPLLFVTGYTDVSIVPPRLQNVPRLPKPVVPADFRDAVKTYFRDR
jgi:DNA-binding NarL/FixJ family response regulator